MYYKKVLIKSADDLPKEDDVYFIKHKNLSSDDYFKGYKVWMWLTTSQENTEERKRNYWLENIDWYLQPIDNPEIDLREEFQRYEIWKVVMHKNDSPSETYEEIIDEYLKSQKQ